MFNFEEYIREQVKEINVEDIVRQEIHKQIGDEFTRQYRSIIRTEIDEIIKTEIEIAMKKSVQTDDGWGKKENYESFEALFKKEFKERLDRTWEVQKIITKQVQEKVNQLFNKNFSEVIEKIVKELTVIK